MRKSLAFIVFLFVTTELWSQDPFYKKVGSNSLPYPALDICFDTENKIFAVCASEDSVYSYTYDINIDTWSKRGSIFYNNNHLNSLGGSNVKCFYLKNELYLILTDNVSTIYKESGTGFSKISELRSRFGSVGVSWIETSNDKAYLFGNFDSLDNNILNGDLLIYNGSNFTQPAGSAFHLGGDEPRPFLRNDTIFFHPSDYFRIHFINTLTDSGFIYSNTVPGSDFYTTGVAGSEDELFYFSYELRKGIGIYKNDNRFSSELEAPYFEDANLPTANLHYFDNHLYFTKRYDKTIYEKIDNSIVAIKPPVKQNDTIQGYITSKPGLGAYFVPKTSMIFGTDTLNIARLNLDSADYFEYDSIYLNAFLDVDSNGVNNPGDTNVQGQFFINSFSSNQGIDIKEANEFNFLLLRANKEYSVAAVSSSNACTGVSFEGTLQTDNLEVNKTSDTLIFPFSTKPNFSYQDVDFYNATRARLNDTIINHINIVERGCFFDFRKAYCKVVLNKNTNFIGSVPAPNIRAGNTLFYELDSISSARKATIVLETSYSNTNFSIGDKAVHKVNLYSNSNLDESIAQDSLITTMVYSYDPNIKICQPSGVVTQDIDKIKYTIHFENEGNDVARRVVIKDTIDTRMPVIWFRMINSSHPYAVTIRNNVITWTFDNINLAAKSEDPKASRGYVSFEAKVNNPMAIGDSIRNKASIYFDNNAPIITNYAKLKRDDNIKSVLPPPIVGSYLTIYPNPTKDNFTASNTNNTGVTLVVYDIKGAVIKKYHLAAEESIVIDASYLSRGVYILNVDGTGESIKLFKE